jgi:hypothetical protein
MDCPFCDIKITVDEILVTSCKEGAQKNEYAKRSMERQKRRSEEDNRIRPKD